jgi:hypothetical protein
VPGNIYVVDAGYYGGDYIVLIKADNVNFYCYTNITNDLKNLFFNLSINEEKKIEMINNGYIYAMNKN